MIKQILVGGPQSQIAAKALLSRLRDKNDEEDSVIWTARLIAEIRATDEAKSGISAFLNKTPPPWHSKP
jgi:methylglutaconyl-CoA hydratase